MEASLHGLEGRALVDRQQFLEEIQRARTDRTRSIPSVLFPSVDFLLRLEAPVDLIADLGQALSV